MIYAIRQSITATNQFDGTVPATTPVDSAGVRTYPADDGGGLFTFDFDFPVSVTGIHFFFDDALDWNVFIVDAAGDLEVAGPGAEPATSFLLEPPQELLLLPGQDVKVTTSGATQAMYCTVMFGSAHRVSWADKL